VMDAMRRTSIRPILFASTGAVYGDLCAEESVSEAGRTFTSRFHLRRRKGRRRGLCFVLLSRLWSAGMDFPLR
jgi:hypothetical protein